MGSLKDEMINRLTQKINRTTHVGVTCGIVAAATAMGAVVTPILGSISCVQHEQEFESVASEVYEWDDFNASTR